MNELAGVLRVLADGDRNAAVRLLAAPGPSPGGLAEALLTYLAATTEGSVYDEPTGFETFISHGSNPELYARTIDHLRRIHATLEPRTVLDIGCGDGRVTRNVIGPHTAVIDLVEPSHDLLSRAEAGLVDRRVEVRGTQTSVVDYLDELGRDARWDLAQSTFALHNLDPRSRRTVLQGLAERTERLSIVEFDVPDLSTSSIAWLEHLAARYEIGVREYLDHPEAVQGFLMPVLVAQLEPGRQRHTFEQSASAWRSELQAAGFGIVDLSTIHDYWWAPAIALDARRASERR